MGPVSKHYSNAGLLSELEKAIGAMGFNPDTLTAEALTPVEEFHIGGRGATEALLHLLPLTEDSHVLDIGCGTGGTARFAAASYGCKVTGVDLSANYVEVGKTVSHWLGLTSQVHLECRCVLDSGLEDGAMDGAWMFHAGMNIADKHSLFGEVYRILKPGSAFLIYDVMRPADADAALPFPLPWASCDEISHLETLDTYVAGLEAAGFEVEAQGIRLDIADSFFDKVEATEGAAGAPLHLGIVMGADAREKTANLLAAYRKGLVAPGMVLARKA